MIYKNNELLNQAWKSAFEVCDPTCPHEVIREKAQQIFENLLILN